MTAAGSKKQEDKIVDMGKLAKELFPEISMETFEEAFRQSINTVLKKHQYQQWSDVTSEQPLTRKNFFDSILSESKVTLKNNGLREDQIDILIEKLTRRNRRYLG